MHRWAVVIQQLQSKRRERNVNAIVIRSRRMPRQATKNISSQQARVSLRKPVNRDDPHTTQSWTATFKEKDKQYKIVNTINPKNRKSNSRTEGLNKKILTIGKKIEKTKHA